MKNGQPVWECQRALAFLAEAPLRWLMLQGQISQFAPESLLVTGDETDDWAFLVLNGSCELRRNPPPAGRGERLETYTRGETFCSFIPPETTLVAAEDSAIFSIRLRDLVEIVPRINGRHRAVTPEISPRIPEAAQFTFTLDAPRGSVVTLAFFSGSLPEHSLTGAIARRLQMETAGSVMLVQLVASADASADGVLDEHFVPPPTVPEIAPGLWRLRIRVVGEPSAPEVLDELLRRLRCRFDYVLLSLPAESISTRVSFQCIEQSRSAYFFLRRNPEDLYHLDLLLHELRPALKGIAAVEFKSVLCLAEHEVAAGFDARIEQAGIRQRFSIRQCPLSATADFPAGLTHADIRRVARSIGDCLIGLALSSGAAKGYSHIGVIQVLEENGIEADVVAGASMGAYIGSIWAFGCDGSQMEKLAFDMKGRWTLLNLIDPVFPPRQGFLRGYSVKRRLQQTIGDVEFPDLVRPLRVLATNLDTLGRVVFSSGSVATAVHTSIAVPGIFVPVRVGDESFVDGGIVDPLPTDVLLEMGIRKIIAVNAMPSPEYLRLSLQAREELRAHPVRLAKELARKFLPFNRHINYFARGNILEILMHSVHGAQVRMAEDSCRHARVVLRPDVGHDSWLDFRNPGQYIQAGREAAGQHLAEIKALVQEKETHYEPRPITASLATVA
jgi:NTE family protein